VAAQPRLKPIVYGRLEICGYVSADKKKATPCIGVAFKKFYNLG
jgi:hypothetical protein